MGKNVSPFDFLGQLKQSKIYSGKIRRVIVERYCGNPSE
jgi:hypothetical protein